MSDAIYVVAIRSAHPRNGQEVVQAIDALRDKVRPVTEPHVVALEADEATANHHDALRTLGFSWEAANRIAPVVGEPVA